VVRMLECPAIARTASRLVPWRCLMVSTNNWIRLSDGKVEIFEDWWTNSSDPFAMRKDFKRLLSIGSNMDHNVVDFQSGSPTKGDLTTFLSFPKHKYCYASDSCDKVVAFYYWPELKQILIFDDVTKKLKTLPTPE